MYFEVIHQISRSHGLKNGWFESKITRPVAAIRSLRFVLDWQCQWPVKFSLQHVSCFPGSFWYFPMFLSRHELLNEGFCPYIQIDIGRMVYNLLRICVIFRTFIDFAWKSDLEFTAPCRMFLFFNWWTDLWCAWLHYYYQLRMWQCCFSFCSKNRLHESLFDNIMLVRLSQIVLKSLLSPLAISLLRP